MFPRCTSVTVIVSMGLDVCPNHKQELSSVYQFIDVLYNLCWVLSSSDERLMEFYDPLVNSDLLVTSLSPTSLSLMSMRVCTVLCNHLKYSLYLGNYGLLPNLGNDWLLPVSVAIGRTPR